MKTEISDKSEGNDVYRREEGWANWRHKKTYKCGRNIFKRYQMQRKLMKKWPEREMNPNFLAVIFLTDRVVAPVAPTYDSTMNLR